MIFLRLEGNVLRLLCLSAQKLTIKKNISKVYKGLQYFTVLLVDGPEVKERGTVYIRTSSQSVYSRD